MYSVNMPPLVPLRVRVERLTVGPAGQVWREEERNRAAVVLHWSSRRQGGVLGRIQRDRKKEGVEAHLPVPVARREMARTARYQALKRRLWSGLAGEEEDDGEGWFQGLQHVQTAPMDLQGVA